MGIALNSSRDAACQHAGLLLSERHGILQGAVIEMDQQGEHTLFPVRLEVNHVAVRGRRIR